MFSKSSENENSSKRATEMEYSSNSQQSRGHYSSFTLDRNSRLSERNQKGASVAEAPEKNRNTKFLSLLKEDGSR